MAYNNNQYDGSYGQGNNFGFRGTGRSKPPKGNNHNHGNYQQQNDSRFVDFRGRNQMDNYAGQYQQPRHPQSAPPLYPERQKQQRQSSAPEPVRNNPEYLKEGIIIPPSELIKLDRTMAAIGAHEKEMDIRQESIIPMDEIPINNPENQSEAEGEESTAETGDDESEQDSAELTQIESYEDMRAELFGIMDQAPGWVIEMNGPSFTIKPRDYFPPPVPEQKTIEVQPKPVEKKIAREERQEAPTRAESGYKTSGQFKMTFRNFKNGEKEYDPADYGITIIPDGKARRL